MLCPVCSSNAEVSGLKAVGARRGHLVECDRCGPFFASEEAMHDLPSALRGDSERIARVAHGLRRMGARGNPPFLTTHLIENLLGAPLPTLFEQVNNLMRWLGENSAGPGEDLLIQGNTHQFIVGAKSPKGVMLVVEHLIENEYVTGPIGKGTNDARLTLKYKGWELLDRLQRGQVDSRRAFMAMGYGNALLDRIVSEVFRPAVAQTGFELTRLDDRPRAGLIDDRLRVEIRNSRFLIADLSHDNLGAYWEAGYAEGLGKPVIYTCERKKFDQDKTHFDTNHHLTVVWDKRNPKQAAEELKATIRETLPSEAKITDT